MRLLLLAIAALAMLTACGSPDVANVGPTQTRTAELAELTAIAAKPTNTAAPIVVIIATQPPTPTPAGITTYWAVMGPVLATMKSVNAQVASACLHLDEQCKTAQVSARPQYQQAVNRLTGVPVPTQCKAVDRAATDYINASASFISKAEAYMILKPTEQEYIRQSTRDMDGVITTLKVLNQVTESSNCQP